MPGFSKNVCKISTYVLASFKMRKPFASDERDMAKLIFGYLRACFETPNKDSDIGFAFGPRKLAIFASKSL